MIWSVAGRVVEHDQHPAGREHRPIPAHGLRFGERHVAGAHAERPEHLVQRVAGRQRAQAGAGALEVEVELPVGVTVDGVRRVHGQRRLTHPGRSVQGDHGGPSRRGRQVRRASQHGLDPGQFVLSPHEDRGSRWELARRCGRRDDQGLRRLWRGHRRLPAEHLDLEALELRAGFDAELGGERLPDRGEGVQGRGHVAAAVQRDHQHLPEAFPERMPGRQLAQFRGDLPVLAQTEPGIEVVLPDGLPILDEPGGDGLERRPRLGVLGRAAMPQRQSVAQFPLGQLELAPRQRRPAASRVRLEAGQVQLLAADPEQIAGPRCHHPLPAGAVVPGQQLPQLHHVRAEVRHRGPRAAGATPPRPVRRAALARPAGTAASPARYAASAPGAGRPDHRSAGRPARAGESAVAQCPPTGSPSGPTWRITTPRRRSAG